MKYSLLLILISFGLVVLFVVVGVYTPVGQGFVTRFPSGEIDDSLSDEIDDSLSNEVDDDSVSDIDATSFEPNVIRVVVDSVVPIVFETEEDGEDVYIAAVVQLDDLGNPTSIRYDMLMSFSLLGDAYVSLEPGDIAQVAIDSIEDFGGDGNPALYPLAVIKE